MKAGSSGEKNGTMKGKESEMKGVTPEEIRRAKEMDLLTYLRNFEPQELVHLGGSNYCTRTHDSLKISDGMWMWFSRGFGGRSALDYLIKVKKYSFVEAVNILNGQEIKRKSPVFSCPKPEERKVSGGRWEKSMK